METLVASIIGLGKIGVLYDLQNNKLNKDQTFTHIGAITKSKYFRLGMLVEPNLETVLMMQKLFPNIRITSELVKGSCDKSDLVIISTPTYTHFKILYEVIDNFHPKVILIEKPFGSNYLESNQMLKVLKESGIKTYVNYFRRYLPHFNSLRSDRYFQSRGLLLKVKLTAYGSIANIFSHFFDLLAYLEGTHYLTNSKKDKLLKTTSSIQFIDTSVGVYYSLEGIGSSQINPYMKLEYENLTIIIHNNGRDICLLSSNNVILRNLNCPEEIFINYQLAVLNTIGLDWSGENNYEHVEQSVRIHSFIESFW
jgi:hypothetical protein